MLLQQSLDADDSVADSILQSARRKYAAMKRLATKQVVGTRTPTHPMVHGGSSVNTVAQDAKDKKVIEAMLKGGGGSDHKTLMSRLETAIADHKLSTRGLVEAVHEAQKVVNFTYQMRIAESSQPVVKPTGQALSSITSMTLQ